MLHNTALAQKVSLTHQKRDRETLNINRLCFTVSQPVTYLSHVGVTTNQIPSEAGAKQDQDEAMNRFSCFLHCNYM